VLKVDGRVAIIVCRSNFSIRWQSRVKQLPTLWGLYGMVLFVAGSAHAEENHPVSGVRSLSFAASSHLSCCG